MYRDVRDQILRYQNTSDEPEPEISSSSQAKLWRFRAEPSRAMLGHFNFRAETELDFFDISK